MTSSLILWATAFAMLSQSCFVISTTFDDSKNYYPDPSPPTVPVPVPHITPPPHSPYPVPTPPYRGTPPSPSGGGNPPSANCGNPPSGHHTPDPSPPPSGGGSHHHNPSPPSSGGGSYYHSPPTAIPTPTTPYVSSPPPVIGTPYVSSPPIITTPPTPGITIPSPPFSFDPNSPPFTCTYWRNHPTLIWGLFGWWGTTVGSAFGVTSLPGVGASTNILQALSNTRSDGLGQLYREGTAALLNSVAHTRFPYTSSEVRDRFVAALGSNKAAAAQAHKFKRANEGKTKRRE